MLREKFEKLRKLKEWKCCEWPDCHLCKEAKEKLQTLEKEIDDLDRICTERTAGASASSQGAATTWGSEQSKYEQDQQRQKVAVEAAERDQSYLQRIRQLLIDSFDLLYNVRQLLLEIDRTLADKKNQQVPRQNDTQRPSKAVPLHECLGQLENVPSLKK